MKSIAMFNNKGGVGKTTLVCNLASYASHQKKKVLMIDADPQCNTTAYCFGDDLIETIYEKKELQTIGDIVSPVSAGTGYVESIEPKRNVESFEFDLIPGNPELAVFEDTLAQDWGQALSGNTRGLRTTLTFYDIIHKCEAYDYIFFDMSPSLGAINRAILLGCDYFITPLSTDIFSLLAIGNIGKSIQQWNDRFHVGLSYSENVSNQFGNINRIKYLGYVIQQYTSKTVDGKRRPVKAYERISSRVPEIIDDDLLAPLEQVGGDIDYSMGAIPNYNSVIPMSQTAHKPVFELSSRDGIVGAHFSKVKEYNEVIQGIYKHMTQNIKTLEQVYD